MVPKPPNAGVKFGQRHRLAREAKAGPTTSRQRQITSGRRILGALPEQNAVSARAAPSSRNGARSYREPSSGAKGGADAASGRNSDVAMMDKARDTFIRRFIEKNSNFIGELDPSMAALPFPAQVKYLKEHLDSRYNGDHIRFFNDLQGDEQDLRLKASVQVRESINPLVTYGVPHSQMQDGYETARQKHKQQIERVLLSARSEQKQSDLPYYNRTKGTISDYGSFSSWAKYRQLNATAMLNR